MTFHHRASSFRATDTPVSQAPHQLHPLFHSLMCHGRWNIYAHFFLFPSLHLEQPPPVAAADGDFASFACAFIQFAHSQLISHLQKTRYWVQKALSFYLLTQALSNSLSFFLLHEFIQIVSSFPGSCIPLPPL